MVMFTRFAWKVDIENYLSKQSAVRLFFACFRFLFMHRLKKNAVRNRTTCTYSLNYFNPFLISEMAVWVKSSNAEAPLKPELDNTCVQNAAKLLIPKKKLTAIAAYALILPLMHNILRLESRKIPGFPLFFGPKPWGNLRFLVTKDFSLHVP